MSAVAAPSDDWLDFFPPSNLQRTNGLSYPPYCHYCHKISMLPLVLPVFPCSLSSDCPCSSCQWLVFYLSTSSVSNCLLGPCVCLNRRRYVPFHVTYLTEHLILLTLECKMWPRNGRCLMLGHAKQPTNRKHKPLGLWTDNSRAACDPALQSMAPLPVPHPLHVSYRALVTNYSSRFGRAH
jgi:hypothetical protein